MTLYDIGFFMSLWIIAGVLAIITVIRYDVDFKNLNFLEFGILLISVLPLTFLLMPFAEVLMKCHQQEQTTNDIKEIR